MGTGSFFGNDELDFGPCNVYFDTETGGQNLNLGGFDSVKISKQVKKIELKEAQAGDRPADRAVSGQIYQISFGMSRPNIERLKAVVQGIATSEDTAGNITQIRGVDVVGQRDSQIWKQCKAIKIVDGEESEDPLEEIYFLRVAAMSDNVELTYDATSQRYYMAVLECYKSDETDEDGKFIYWRSGIKTYP